MIQSGKFDSSNMDIKKLANSLLIFRLTNVFASVKAVKLLPSIQIFILFLILTTKIR